MNRPRHVLHKTAGIRVKVPIPTESELNKHEHWRNRQRRRKKQREAVAWMLSTQRIPRLPADVWLTRISPRALDEGDNLNSAFKAIRDEIANWLGVDDNDSRVLWRYCQTRGEPREQAVLIEIFSDR